MKDACYKWETLPKGDKILVTATAVTVALGWCAIVSYIIAEFFFGG